MPYLSHGNATRAKRLAMDQRTVRDFRTVFLDAELMSAFWTQKVYKFVTRLKQACDITMQGICMKMDLCVL